MPRRNPRKPNPHAEGAEENAPHRSEERERVQTAIKEAGVQRGKEMIARGEIWRPGFPGIPKR